MDISVNIMERNAFYDTLYQGNLQLTFIRWFYDYPDPNNGYFDMFYSRKVSGKRQQWANDEFDDLTIQGKEAVDPDERLEIYRQCETIMQEEVCYVPTTYMINPYIFKPWVKGLPVNAQGFTVPNGNIYVNMLSDVYVEGREA
jgi:ABC-type oligopeptide transport system substrate-binding subunit